MAPLKDELKGFLHLYYLANFLLCLSFPVCKVMSPICDVLFEGECEFDMRQMEILFFLLIVVMIRARKTGSMTFVSYFNNSFIYCKVANLVLWFLEYKPYGLTFAILFFLQGFLLPQPVYGGPQNVIYFRDKNTFKEEISRDVVWLIEFYTAWNPSCVNFAPIFAELSAIYTTPSLKFGKVDLGRFPDIGADYGIKDSAFKSQLPFLMLFKNGTVTLYRPVIQAGKLVKFHFNKENIIFTFDLNNLKEQAVARDAAEKKEKKEKKSHIKAD